MKKNTIAFLTRSLIDATGKNIWHGIVGNCKKEKIPIITFRGPVLNTDNGSIIYHLFGDETFSGVISWASSDVTQDVIDYYSQFKNTNIVCLTFKVPGHPVIFADCIAGMNELVSHLIEVHGYSKIAFVRGPEHHAYAKDRLEGYKTAIEEHGLTVDERLISEPGGWGLPDGMKAVERFIQNGLVPGKDFEAVVCAGDNIAIGAQEYLIKKGYLVPHDIAVCGFNGSDDAAWCNPPLTTVEMPFKGIGVQAFKTLIDKMNGQPVEQESRYTTSLLLAESCGCKSVSIQKAIIRNDFPEDEKKTSLFSLFKKEDPEVKREEAEASISDPLWQKDTEGSIIAHVSSARNVEKVVVDFFTENTAILIKLYAQAVVEGKTENSDFIDELTKCLNSYLDISKRFPLWQDFMSILNRSADGVIYGTVLAGTSGNLLQQARILIHEFDSRSQKQSALWDLRYDADLRATSADLLSSYEIPVLMDILAKSLKKLKIPGVYVIMYENCDYEKTKKIPPKSRLILAVRDGERLNLGREGFLFDTEKILPDQFLPQSSFYSLILESLHFQNDFLGYIIFQEGPADGGPYVALRDQLSSSLHGAILLKTLNTNKTVVEKTVETMTEQADIVSENSQGISSNISTVSTSMGEVAESIRTISDDIMTVARTVNNAKELISGANRAMNTLAESTSKISEAIATINAIAETTNVLALNASIEASHAGDAGKGFSVVAKEVKVLAAQTVERAEHILELVTRNNKNTQEAKKVIKSTNESIVKIAELSENIKNSISEQVGSTATISARLSDASVGAKEISGAIGEIAVLGNSLRK